MAPPRAFSPGFIHVKAKFGDLGPSGFTIILLSSPFIPLLSPPFGPIQAHPPKPGLGKCPHFNLYPLLPRPSWTSSLCPNFSMKSSQRPDFLSNSLIIKCLGFFLSSVSHRFVAVLAQYYTFPLSLSTQCPYRTHTWFPEYFAECCPYLSISVHKEY